MEDKIVWESGAPEVTQVNGRLRLQWRLRLWLRVGAVQGVVLAQAQQAHIAQRSLQAQIFHGLPKPPGCCQLHYFPTAAAVIFELLRLEHQGPCSLPHCSSSNP